jgi:VCBS repeat protein/uncharacterized protein DUF1573
MRTQSKARRASGAVAVGSISDRRLRLDHGHRLDRRHRRDLRRRLVLLAVGAVLVLCVGLASAGAAGGTFSFATAAGSPVATGASPVAIATGDLNGDGKTDLVSADYAANAVSVLVGNGDGTFKSKVDYPAGDGPKAVAIADLNGDGKPDLVVADSADDTVSVLLGNGDGTFKPAVAYPTGAGPDAVAVGDLNGDKKLDLVVANSTDDTVSVLLGNGDGTFKGKVDYQTGTDPAAVVLADLNGDKKLDVVTANTAANTVSVLLGNGDGTLGGKVDYATGASPVALAVADLNADSKPDVVVANNVAGTLSVLLGNGDGTFKAKVDYGSGPSPSGVAIGDINADGSPDLVAVNSGANSASILFGKGDGTFPTKQDLNAGTSPQALALGDLNGDAKPDLVVADGGNAGISALLNTSVSTVTATTVPAFPAQLFGTKSAPQSLTVTNNGSAGLAIKSVTASTSYTSSGCSGKTIAAGASCAITVTFAPKAYGTVTGTLTITTNAPGSPTTVALSGTGLPPSARVISLPVSTNAGAYATLNGSVISQGPGTFFFQYGDSTAYGSTTPTLPLASSANTQLLASTVPLDPGYTYHYRIVASNLVGPVDGGDQVFSTPPDPPTITAATGEERLRTVLQEGLRLSLSQTSPAAVKVTASIDAKTAHAAHLISRKRTSVAPVAVGKATVEVSAGVSRVITLKLRPRDASRLAKLARVTFSFAAHAVSAADKAGQPTELSLSLAR